MHTSTHVSLKSMSVHPTHISKTKFFHIHTHPSQSKHDVVLKLSQHGYLPSIKLNIRNFLGKVFLIRLRNFQHHHIYVQVHWKDSFVQIHLTKRNIYTHIHTHLLKHLYKHISKNIYIYICISKNVYLFTYYIIK